MATSPTKIAVPAYGSVNANGSINRFDPNTGKSTAPTTAPTTAPSGGSLTPVYYDTAGQAFNNTAQANASNVILNTQTMAGNGQRPTFPTQKDTNPYQQYIDGIKSNLISPMDATNAGIDNASKKETDSYNSLMSLIGTPPSSADAYNKAQNETGILQKQQLVTDLTGKLNTITATGEANKLSVVGQGRGIPEGIIGGQQAQMARETAIQALPVSAQLNAAQGNLQMAQQNLNTLFQIYSTDATNAYNYKKDSAMAVYDIASKAEQKKLDVFLQNIKDQKDAQQKVIDTNHSIALEASKTGRATADQLTQIANAPDFASAMKAAGTSLAPSPYDFMNINGTVVRVNKNTGAATRIYGGTDTPLTTPIIRTIKTSDGKNVSVDSYSLIKGDDPYFIAKNNGTDMAGLQKLNPNITDWNNLPIGATINVPSKTTGEGSILAVTGLSMPAFQFLTIGTTALTRMTAPMRLKYMTEAQNYVNKTGTDVATFQAQYGALSKTVGANVLRNNQSVVAEAEIDATLKNLSTAADDASFKGMKWVNIAKMFAGQQFNDANVSKYSFHLNQLREEFAMYNMALAGQLDANGNIREINEVDRKTAENIIRDGFAKGSITGFEEALTASRSKMQTVLQASINAQNKQVWNLFGVGDQYQAPMHPIDPLLNIQNFGNNHPEQQQTLTKMKLDGITVEDINNWVNQHTQ